MSIKEDIKEKIDDKIEEGTEKFLDKLTNNTAYVKADDWLGEHNFFSRLTIVVFLGILIYAFVTPLDLGYVEIAAWLAFGTFVIISVGINSIKTIGDVLIKIKESKGK